MREIPQYSFYHWNKFFSPLIWLLFLVGGFLFLSPVARAVVPEYLEVFSDQGNYVATTTALTGSWGDVTLAGFDHFEVMISSSSTTPDAVENAVTAWQSVLDANVATISSLDLTIGQTYYFCVRAVAIPENYILDCSDGITIDFTAPTTNISATSNGIDYTFGSSTNNNVTISLSSDDVDAGLTYYCIGNVCLSEGDYSIYSEPVELSDEGETIFNFFGKDQAGNAEDAKSRVINIDLTSPYVLSVTTTSTQEIYSGGDVVDIAVKFSEPVFVTGDYLEYLRIVLNAQENNGYAVYSSGSGTDTLIFRYVVGAQDYTTKLDYYTSDSLEIDANYIKDAAGNDAIIALPSPDDENQSLGHYDMLVNTPIFSSPADDQGASGTITLSLEARDTDSVASLDIYREGTEDKIGSATHTSGNGYLFSLDTMLLPDGETYLKAAKVTGVGNVFYSNLKRIFIDNTAPEAGSLDFKIDSAATSTVSATDDVFYLGSFEDAPGIIRLDLAVDDQNMATSTVGIYNAGILVGQFINNGTTWQSSGLDDSDISVGANNLTANFIDTYGNASSIVFRINIVVKYMDISFILPVGSSGTSTASTSVAEKTIVSIDTGNGTSTVTMATGTVITRTDGEDFDLSAIGISTTSLEDIVVGDTFDAKAAMQWGIPNIGLSFSPAITIDFFVGNEYNGQTLEVRRSTTGQSGWTDDGIVAPKTCLVAGGICTFSTTKASYFSAMTAVSRNGGASSATLSEQKKCSKVVYTDWAASCFGSVQYRYVADRYPAGCELDSVQEASLQRACGSSVGSGSKDGSTSARQPLIRGVKMYADGSILRGADKKLYLIERGQAKRIFSLQDLRKLGVRKIYDVSDIVLVEYHIDNIILRSPTGRIYLILNGKKYYIPNLAALKKYTGRKIYDASEEVIGSYGG